MNFNPTRGTGNRLPPVICTPALNKTDSNGTHPRKLVDSLESLMNRLGKALGKVLVVEYLEVVARGDLAYCRWMPAADKIGVWRLNKDATLAKTLGKDLSPDVHELYSLPDVTAGLFDRGITMHIREKSKTKSFRRAGVGEPIDDEGWLGGIEDLSNTRFHFIVVH